MSEAREDVLRVYRNDIAEKKRSCQKGKAAFESFPGGQGVVFFPFILYYSIESMFRYPVADGGMVILAKIIALCTSSQRQEPKSEVAEAHCVHGGIEGDAHRGVTEREISLLRAEDIRRAEQEAGFVFPPGSLAENLVVEGLAEDLAPGARLSIGPEAVLEVVEKGKKPGEPHSYSYKGWCLLPTAGFFLRVIEEGVVSKGDEVESL